ncbi:MAG: COG2426 family protein [Bacillota bacterium]
MTEALTFKEILTVVFTAILPYAELRGAIPLAILAYKANPWEAFFWAVLGNALPIIPVMLFIPMLGRWADRNAFIHRVMGWLHRKTEKNRDKINKYGLLGLAIFVAIPLPLTGVWTGAAIAYLLGIRKRFAFFALLLGAVGAGIIVTVATIFGISFNDYLQTIVH